MEAFKRVYQRIYLNTVIVLFLFLNGRRSYYHNILYIHIANTYVNQRVCVCIIIYFFPVDNDPAVRPIDMCD